MCCLPYKDSKLSPVSWQEMDALQRFYVLKYGYQSPEWLTVREFLKKCFHAIDPVVEKEV